MQNYRYPLGIALVAALTLAGGVVYGRMSNRWGPSQSTTVAAAKLAELPTEIPGWRLAAASEMDETVAAILQPVGSLLRRYENQKTGRAVDVMLIVGPIGPTAVHTPEVCMSAQTYQIDGRSEQVSIAGGTDSESFWRAKFLAKSLNARQLEVFYAWSRGDLWSAPEDARWAFIGSPYLYKIQVTGPRVPGAPATEGACYEFLRDFLPLVKSHLVLPDAK